MYLGVKQLQCHSKVYKGRRNIRAMAPAINSVINYYFIYQK